MKAQKYIARFFRYLNTIWVFKHFYLVGKETFKGRFNLFPCWDWLLCDPLNVDLPQSLKSLDIAEQIRLTLEIFQQYIPSVGPMRLAGLGAGWLFAIQKLKMPKWAFLASFFIKKQPTKTLFTEDYSQPEA